MFEPPIDAYDDYFNNDVLISVVVLAWWAVLARRLYLLPYRRRAVRVRRTTRLFAAGLVIGVLLVVGRILSSLVLAGYGWQFAADRMLIGLPIVVLPAVVALAVTLPALRRLGGTPAAAPLTDEQRRRAASPAMSFPARTVAVGALVSFVQVFFAPAPPLLWPAVASYGVVGLWWAALCRRHAGRVGTDTVRPRSRPVVRIVRTAGTVAATLALIVALGAWDWQTSKLPDTYSMTEHGMTYGNGSGPMVHQAHVNGSAPQGRPLTQFTGPRDVEPDRRITLTATDTRFTLSSGRKVDALAFNGQVPGPEIRVRQGELVEVTLVNNTADTPTTIHWHGLDVPNAEDGVAGLTQDAVRPGQRHVYRWRAEQTGSFWYHSHQSSSTQVRRGLFGPLVIEKADAKPGAVRDIVAAAHVFDTDDGEHSSFNATDTLGRQAVPPGTPVRLRLINADNFRKYFTVAGTPFRVTAIDGADVNGPTELNGTKLMLGGGGRFDVEFTMPATPVRLTDLAALDAGLLLSPNGGGELAALRDGPEFDPTRYGSPIGTPFGPDSRFDRSFDLVLDNRPGFYDGQPYYLWTVNGSVFPNVPMLMVKEGELVKVTIANRSFLEHPMHLHGHHVLVLSRNGRPVTGSPLWLDTVTLLSGETYELAFRADNPGLWMDHCHNLVHAAMGMTLHLGYDSVSTPFRAGRATGNTPE